MPKISAVVVPLRFQMWPAVKMSNQPSVIVSSAGMSCAAADSTHDAGTSLSHQPLALTTIACENEIARITSIEFMLPSPALYSEPDAQPPVKTMPKPKIAAPMTMCQPIALGWKVLKPASVTIAATTAYSATAIIMPTAMRGTLTANRSRTADAMQKRPYCSSMP